MSAIPPKADILETTLRYLCRSSSGSFTIFAAIRRAKEIETLNVHSGTITKRPLTRGRFLMHFVRQADSAETLRAFYVTSSSIWPSFS